MPMQLIRRKVNSDGTVQADLIIPQGDDVTLMITVMQSAVPVPLTSYHAKAEVRATVGGALLLAFDSTASPATIVIDGTAGTITLSQLAATTAALAPGTYAWDLEWTDASGVVTTIMRGRCTIVAEVTT